MKLTSQLSTDVCNIQYVNKYKYASVFYYSKLKYHLQTYKNTQQQFRCISITFFHFILVFCWGTDDFALA